MRLDISPFSSKFRSGFSKYLSCILDGLFYIVDSYYSHIMQEKCQVLVLRCQILKEQTVNHKFVFTYNASQEIWF